MTNADKDIRTRILSAQTKAQQPVVMGSATPPVAPKNKSQTTMLLGVVILIMSVLTVGGLLYKKRSANPPSPPLVQERVVVEKQPVDNPSYAKKSDVEAHFAALNKRLDEQDKRLAAWSHRLWLVGVAHNENVNLKIMEAQGRGQADPGYIYFDADWKLSRMPKTIEMDDKAKEDLRKDVK